MAYELEDLRNAYFANCDYASAADLTKAKAFATACRQLILWYSTTRSQFGSGETELSPAALQEELKKADAWVASASGASGAGYRVCVPTEDFRS